MSAMKLPKPGLWQEICLVPAALIGIRLLIPALIGVLYLWISPTHQRSTAPWIELISAALVCAACLGAYNFLMRTFRRSPVAELRGEAAQKELFLGAVAGLGLVSLAMSVQWLLGFWRFTGINVDQAMWWGVAIGLSASVFEELLARGILFRLIDIHHGPWWALVISTVVFGSLHLMNPGITWFGAMMLTLGAGPLLGAAYLWKRTLWLPIGLHFGWNLAQASLWSQNVSGTGEQQGLLGGIASGPDWATGGSVGMEGSVFTALICLGVSAVIIYVLHRNGRLYVSTPTSPETNRGAS